MRKSTGVQGELEEIYRKRFRRGSPIGVALQASLDLQREGAPLTGALGASCDWMVAYGRGPSLDEFGMLVATLSGSPDGVTGARTLYVVLRAMEKWMSNREGRSFLACAGGFAGASMQRWQDVDTDLQIAILDLAERISAPHCHTLEARVGLTWTRGLLGNVFARCGQIDRVQHGLRMLEQQAAVAKTLAREGAEGAGSVYGQILHNLGATLQELPSGNLVENLRRSISALIEATQVPERAAEPKRLAFSHRSLGAAYRLLARHVEDPEEKRRLTGLALEAATQAQRVRQQYDPTVDAFVLGTRVNQCNARLDLLDLRRAQGELSEAQYLELAAPIAKSGLTRAQLLAARCVGERTTRFAADHAASRYRAILERVRPLSPAECADHLADLASRFESGSTDLLTHIEANRFAGILRELVPSEVPRSAWGDLALLFRRVHLLQLGMEQARGLMQEEARFLGSIEDPGAGGRGLCAYVDQGIEAFGRFLADPTLPTPHRRFFAAWLRVFALRRLEWAGASPVTTAERLRLIDLSGAGAFRADARFYGQGPTAEGRDGLPLQTEAEWRLQLYRTRQFLEDHAHVLWARELERSQDSSPLTAMLQGLGAVVASTNHTMAPDGTFHAAPLLEPTAGFAEERSQLKGLLGYGRAQGWAPATEAVATEPAVSGLGEFFRERPDVGVLVIAHTGEILLAHASAAGAIDLLSATEAIGDDASRSLKEAIHDFGPLLPTLGGALVGADGERFCPDAPLRAHDPCSLGGLPPGVSIRGPGCDECKRFDSGLRALLSAMEPLGDFVARQAERRGISGLGVLDRGTGIGALPWSGGLLSGPRSGRVLGDVHPIVHLHTLGLNPPRRQAPTEGILTYVGATPGAESPLELARLGFEALDLSVLGPLGRLELERRASRAAVLRLFMHGSFNLFPDSSSWLHIDESIDADQNPAARWLAAEVRCLDLTGCQRAELWACESGAGLDLPGLFHFHEEPTGIDTSFLLAGARRSLASLWHQPALPAALIAAAFAANDPGLDSARADARALAAAVAWYRHIMGPSGVFETAALRAVAARSAAISSRAKACETTLAAGFVAALLDLGASPARVQQLEAGSRAMLATLAPVALEPERPGRALESVEQAVAEQIELFRGPWAWAGWRILARDRGCL